MNDLPTVTATPSAPEPTPKPPALKPSTARYGVRRIGRSV